jgi:threonine/homoserine/homoserine lactone efflux protein
MIQITTVCNALPAGMCNHCEMTFENLLGLVGFAFVTSVTPGPNNLMLMASGANFGLRRTLPHMAGVSLGYAFMALLVGLGLGAAMEAVPPAKTAMKIAAVGYMLWLAWKMAHASAPGEGKAGGKPFSFLQAAAFQWVNPKTWAMAVGAMAAYAGQGGWPQVALVAGVFAAVNFPSVAVWATIGQSLRGVLLNPARLRAFNYTMAALLVASLWPVLQI